MKRKGILKTDLTDVAITSRGGACAGEIRPEESKQEWRGVRLVPGGGVEPPRAEARRILSPLRLPVPPSRLRLEEH
jgi:hypothetical protein